MNRFTLKVPSINYIKDLTLNVKYKAKMYFVAGAGNDTIGWDYTNRFKRIWTNLGISGLKELMCLQELITVNQFHL